MLAPTPAIRPDAPTAIGEGLLTTRRWRSRVSPIGCHITLLIRRVPDLPISEQHAEQSDSETSRTHTRPRER